MNARQNPIQKPKQGGRRGNTIVLVTGILVLLVIIATAFVVRTGAGRVTATATLSAGLQSSNEQIIAQDIAGELGAAALFVHRFDFTSLGAPLDLRVGSNVPRLPMSPTAIKFLGDEQDNDGNGRPDYVYNYPAHEVVPFTNWPDPGTTLDNWGAHAIGAWAGGNGAVADWPFGPGNPTAAIPPGSPLVGEYNPLGNPGMGDFRPLRDLEPQRWDTDGDGIPDAFSHWRHMTNISRADNGWRAVFDISDVGDVNIDGYGQIVTDLNVPFEQFLAITHGYLVNTTGDTNLAALGLNQFIDNWGIWMGVSPAGPDSGLGGYINAYRDPARIPPNYLRLRDLDADGTWMEVGERPQDEFAGPGVLAAYPAGAPRWYVNRILADADGDGYTDSFWFLAPSPMNSGIRTLVAVSIIDNQGMLNANVATRFIRADTTGIPRKTGGHTAADLALVGQGVGIANGNFNCGFYDNWDSWMNIPTEINTSYDTDLVTAGNLWFRHLTEVGLSTGPVATPTAIPFPNVDERLDYWRRSASRPLSADPQSRYTPFTLSDELELRMYAGQNYPWIATRFEWSTSNNITGNGIGPFRANLPREESSEFIDQTINRVQVADLRHRVTLFNGVRNDVAVPWLWFFGPNRDINGDTAVNGLDRDLDGDGIQGDVDDLYLFNAGSMKFDLRLPYDQAGYPVFLPGEWNGAPGLEFAVNERIPTAGNFWRIGIALRDHLRNALMDNYDNLPTNRGTYYGNAVGDIDRTNELATAWAANIAHWRDQETPAVAGDLTSHELSRLSETVPVPATTANPLPTERYMGMEPQPFLVEAYIGHIYADQYGAIPALDFDGTPYTNAGQHVVSEAPDTYSTVIVVQIANPYNRPINLDDPNCEFQVRVFGQELSLANLGVGPLMPASEDQPATMILYAIQDTVTAVGGMGPTELHDKWFNFLDIDTGNDLCPNSQVVRVDTTRWDVESRGVYDSSSEPAVDIRRRDPVTNDWVTIDRIDPPSSEAFGDAISNMGNVGAAPPADVGDPALYDGSDDPAGYPYPALDIGIDGSGFSHWVQWVRATRAWGLDVNDDGEIDSNEVNPRFVFGDYAVSVSAGDPADVTNPVDTNTFLAGGDRYKFADNPDAPAPWFTRVYTREDPTTPGLNMALKAKPTFFNFNHVAAGPSGGDPAFPQWSFPDKGWYGQKTGAGAGSPDNEVVAPINPVPPPGQPTIERVYRTPFPFQMLHKDNDFEQVGELLNVFLYGHKLRFTDNLATGTFTGETITTFSEFLSEANSDLTGYANANARFRLNRLLLAPTATGGGVAGLTIGVGDPASIDDPRHAVPDLPAGLRVFDAFVCDGFGCAELLDVDGSGSTIDEAEERTLANAKGFDGSATPGLPNINTAPPEVLRSMPHMARLVHEIGGITAGQPFYNASGEPLVTTAPNPAAHLPKVMLADSIVQYRERFNGDNTAAWPTGIIDAPNFEGRANPRGFGSVGELLMLDAPGQIQTGPFLVRPASNGQDNVYPEQWRFDMGVHFMDLRVGAPQGNKPFYNNAALDNQVSMRISTDRQDVWDPFAGTPGTPRPDYVAGDAEEANALFAGISNLVTTRSDTFTVYFKVRSFRQNTSVSPPRWDATNAEYIVDDSRYVMLVDRSGVNKPGDAPKILYLEKLPN